VAMHGLIRWFVDNPVASNLLMWLMIIGGLLTLPTLHREEFPNMTYDAVSVRVVYPLATVEEVEQTICVRIEEAIAGTEGISKLKAIAAQGQCTVLAELYGGVDKAKALREIKNKVDGLDSLPPEAELPVVTEEVVLAAVLQVVLAGEVDEHSLKRLGQRMKDDITELPEVSQVSLVYTRPYELSLEISESTLRRHGLTLAQVAETIRANSIDLPGGMVKTAAGHILLRTKTQAYWGADYASIVVLTRADGTQVKLGDIARIVDGFEDSDLKASFDGKRAIVIDVRRIGEEDVLDVANAVEDYLEEAEAWLPDGVDVVVWQDESEELISRIRTLGKNGISGLLLVMLVLTLFLRFSLACWVAVGIPIALLGAVLMFPLFDLSISTMSIIAIILVLGILVDDAVVIGERVHAYQLKGYSARDAAIAGTQEVSLPVIFGVLTTIVTFIPVMLVQGEMSGFLGGIGYTAMLALVFSLLESQLILPSHLARHPLVQEHESKPHAKASWVRRWSGVEKYVSSALARFVERHYRPFVKRAIEWRYTTISAALGMLIVTYGLIAGGHITVQFFPSIAGERLYATVIMPEGTAVKDTEQAAVQLERAAEQLRVELDAERGPDEEASRVKHMMVSVGSQIGKNSMAVTTASGSHFAEVALELNLPEGYSGPSPAEFASRWRELAGAVPDAVEQTYTANVLAAGNAIEVVLRGSDMGDLSEAAALVKQELYAAAGLYDIYDSFRGGKHEIHLQLLPEARTLGLSARDLALQVRQAFYGEEVQRVQRGKDEVRVYVRYPDDERRSLSNLESMRIRTADGTEVPFSSVAKVSMQRGMSKIERVNGKRVVRVIADVDRTQTTPEEVLARLERDVFPRVTQRWPDLNILLAGEAETSDEALGGLVVMTGLSMFLVFGLLAIPLKSYLQPLVVMSVIPFGAVGAMLGHFVLDEDVVFFSLLGVVALAGVVVNASLVLVDKANRLRAEGLDPRAAIVEAACERFKPIVLTTGTTFLGLLPLMSSDDFATSMFVPMAISLGGGVLFSTLISLVLVPSLYCLLEDGPAFVRPIKNSLGRLLRLDSATNSGSR